ncbi:MAG: hypothetical protein ACFB6R_15335 [Alphaproteobacteria bacterium]
MTRVIWTVAALLAAVVVASLTVFSLKDTAPPADAAGGAMTGYAQPHTEKTEILNKNHNHPES